jgi:large subunit ribosomal protein L25
MANRVSIEAEARPRAGKGAARATRRDGRVPGVIYGAREPATLISLDPRVVLRELHRGGWQSRLYDISVDGVSTRALIRDVQHHPVSDAPLHVDFQRLAAGETIRVEVPVHFENELASPGIKRGAVLNVVRHTVEVSADPDHIPEQFIADLTGLDVNDTIRWSNLTGTEGMRPVITDRDFVIATVSPPAKIQEVVAEPGAPAAAPAAKAAPAKAAPKKK